MKKRKILYISGTRADYGLIRETLFQIKKHPSFEVEIVATGMHLMPEFNKTIEEIKKDNFKIYQINATYRTDDRDSIVDFIGEFYLKLKEKVKEIKPDIILVQGDRTEMLVGALVGAYAGIPVLHTHGGETTRTIDEVTRHVITNLAHLHLAPTKKSAERIIKMGEEPWRVFFVGGPGLDSILNKKLLSKKEIAKKYQLDLSKPILLVIQHPVTEAIKQASYQMLQTMEAIKELKYQTILIYPNADPGGRKMIKVIEQYRKYPFIKIYKNLFHLEYLSLMKVVNVMVGNSSGGIIEAPSFHLPVVNIGSRQEGRERAGNIIDVDYNKKEIIRAIKKAIYDKNFKEKVKKCKSLYGDGKTGERIVNILKKIKINQRLLVKKIAY